MPPPLPTNSETNTSASLPGAGTTWGGTGGSTMQLVFPSDLHLMEHWVRFSSFQYSRANRATTSPTQGPFLAHIFLPVPATLATGYNADWTQESLGVIGYGVAALGQEVLASIKKTRGMTSENASKSYADDINRIKGDVVSQLPSAVAALGFELDKYLLGGAISVGIGVQRNPHLALLFQGVNFRSHRFTYNFIARSQQESETLKNIIYAFKYCMHPSYETTLSAGNHLFQYPEEWEIDFAFPNTTFGIQYSVLTSFNINYHGQGVPAYFPDRLPVSVQLDLSFMETTILTKEDITAGRG